MNILSELKKRFSPHGRYKLSMNRLKQVRRNYPNDIFVQKAISVIRKKMYCIPTPNTFHKLHRSMMNLYNIELIKEGGGNDHNLLNGVYFHSPEYNNYMWMFVYEYIDIVLSDSYLRKKLEQAGQQNSSCIADVLSAMPIEGPYQYHKVFLNEGDVIIDAGANVGMFSLFAAKYYNCQCHAFEPSRFVIPTLEKNIQTNMLSNNITIYPLGLSDKNDEVTFTITHDNIGGSTFMCSLSTENIETETIHCISLDFWADENHISKIDFIKADIEGAERLLLRGATNVLKRMQPKLSICTYHLPDDKQVLEKIIKDANPNYVVIHAYDKLYAYVPEKYR
ncbi:MAG: FkbM family methyltransferase [Bacteroidales bacterium]|jgi:FkbM family methyltransferase|nr:FkbM family methyltransferase [Bacteroidales bacterium]